ncbi:hypothetical protein BKA70DRAFT_116171 [Coprinopsis sp. MPI-PUGE-AT-0042]|nr:hypothetical protein BKA70DRAFT_116171 [Coprinopsis sp. MPI-PUGE-AT-0042]
MLRLRTSSVTAPSRPLHRVSKHPRGVSSDTWGSSCGGRYLMPWPPPPCSPPSHRVPTRLKIKPTTILAVLSRWVEITPPPPIHPKPSRSGQRNARRNRSDSPAPWAGDDRVRTLSPQPLPPPRYQKHERSCQHQAGKAGHGAHIDEPWVALRTFTQDPLFGVAPPAWVP